MSRKTKSRVIGFDPLAWMKEGRESRDVDAGRPEGEVPAQANPAPAAPDLSRGSRSATHDPSKAGAPGSSAAPAGSDPSRDSFHLGEAFTIETVRARYAELGALLGRPRVVLDAGALEAIDTAGLQLLAAFVAEAQREGTQVAWQGVTPALRQGAQRLDLAGVLGLPSG